MSEKLSLKKRTGLGKGLESLLGDAKTVNGDKLSTDYAPGNINDIPVNQIETNPYQPRTHFDETALKELAESIKVQGIIQPITVRQLEPEVYQLISGERRLQASKLVGLATIPAYVRTANDQQMLEMALIENIQREDLNPIEVALSYQRLMAECELKQEALGDRVGKNRATVSNYLRLLRLPPDLQASLRDKKLSMGHARAIINVENVEQQLFIHKKIMDEEWSVRRTEEYVRNLMADKAATSKATTKKQFDVELIRVQNQLTSRFGNRVQIRRGTDGRGEIRIPFLSTDDLNRVLELIGY
ncbi:MAG: ParB/RepB/Spo0J family partition protein [Bernardetiaceae bacterium]|jgi:ParB family chromosome partitioning protein|nr:ParB/RepB/Spo0J family partition protein [Bernardetiaceae bacterium]